MEVNRPNRRNSSVVMFHYHFITHPAIYKGYDSVNCRITGPTRPTCLPNLLAAGQQHGPNFDKGVPNGFPNRMGLRLRHPS